MRSENYTVSVIVPVFNGQRYLRECLQSVLTQTYSEVELIVVDDGSTDASVEIAKSLAGDIRLVRQANEGTASARNSGLAASRGSFIALLDQDDIWHADKLERQMEELDRERSSSRSILHYGRIEFFDDETKTTTSSYFPPSKLEFHDLLGHSVIPTQTMLFAVQPAKAVGGFDQSLRGTDDWDFCLRMARIGPCTGLDHSMARVRVHAGQQSRHEKTMFWQAMRVLKTHGRNRYVCGECRIAYGKAKRELSEHYYGTLRDFAMCQIASGHSIAGMGTLSRAVAVNPAALKRLSTRLATSALGL